MDILELAAKDAIVRFYGSATLTWSDAKWHDFVEAYKSYMLTFPHHNLEELLEDYPDSPDSPVSDDHKK